MLFSIIVTSYNYEKYIRNTLESLENQTFKDFEVIVVDDGSTDNSLDIIKEFVSKKEKFKLYTHPNNKNKGLCESIKLGIEKAKGKYICFCESDDYYNENNLKIKSELIKQNPDIKFFVNKTKLFSNNQSDEEFKGRLKYVERAEKKLKNYSQSNKSWEIIKNKNFIPSFLNVTVEKNLFNNINYNSPITPFLDFWLWRQILFTNKFLYIEKELGYWRIHSNSYCNLYEKHQNNSKNIKTFIKSSNLSLIQKHKLSFFIKTISIFLEKFYKKLLLLKQIL